MGESSYAGQRPTAHVTISYLAATSAYQDLAGTWKLVENDKGGLHNAVASALG